MMVLFLSLCSSIIHTDAVQPNPLQLYSTVCIFGEDLVVLASAAASVMALAALVASTAALAAVSVAALETVLNHHAGYESSVGWGW